MTKSQTINALVKVTGLKKKDINEVLNGLTAIGYEEMRVNGKFTIPNLDRKSTRLNSSHKH